MVSTVNQASLTYHSTVIHDLDRKPNALVCPLLTMMEADSLSVPVLTVWLAV